jgi:tRNA(fMet)-specific endonuclease VapC
LKYLLDSNPCIGYIRGKNALIRQNFALHPASDITMCSVVLSELIHGALKSSDLVKNKAAVLRFTRPYQSLPFDDRAAHEYSLLRRDLESRGLPISGNDMMIAAIALANSLTLVTHNTAEFSRVPNLSIEDWEVP